MNFFMFRIEQRVLLALVIMFVVGASVRADGAGDFKAKCAMCHGADGSGSTATGITNGKDKMPAYKGKLTDDQIKGLVVYIRSLAKK